MKVLEHLDDFFPNIPYAIAFESPMPAQNYAQRVNKLVFANQGTGTHTFTTNKLTGVHTNQITGGPAVSLTTNNANKHNRYEIVNVNGKDAFRNRYLIRDWTVRSAYNLYGMSTPLTPNSGAVKDAFDAYFRNKRCIYKIHAIKPEISDTFGLTKVPVVPANVNTTTGVVTFTSHGFPDQVLVRLFPIPGGALPTGWSAGVDYYACSITANTFSLHTNVGDAAGTGTAPVIPTTQGTGGFAVVAGQYLIENERMRFLDEIRDPTGNGNTATTRLYALGAGDNSVIISSDVVISGTGNGNIGAIGRSWSLMVPNGATDIAYAYLRIPPDSVAPTCVDTGLPLTSGYYWVTDTPSSSVFCRLFRNLSDAQASLGLTSNLTNCIKFTGSAGSGYMRLENTERPLSISTDGVTGSNEKYVMFPSTTEPMILASIIDRNDPAATGIMVYHYVNGELLGSYDTTQGKGNTAAFTGAAGNPMTWLNSPAWHVPFEGYAWDTVIGASTDAITYADISAKVDYFMAEHGVA